MATPSCVRQQRPLRRTATAQSRTTMTSVYTMPRIHHKGGRTPKQRPTSLRPTGNDSRHPTHHRHPKHRGPRQRRHRRHRQQHRPPRRHRRRHGRCHHRHHGRCTRHRRTKPGARATTTVPPGPDSPPTDVAIPTATTTATAVDARAAATVNNTPNARGTWTANGSKPLDNPDRTRAAARAPPLQTPANARRSTGPGGGGTSARIG